MLKPKGQINMKARLPKGYGGGPGNMNSMIKQAQKIQDDMTALQEELDKREYEIKAGKILIEMPQTSATILKFIEE